MKNLVASALVAVIAFTAAVPDKAFALAPVPVPLPLPVPVPLPLPLPVPAPAPAAPTPVAPSASAGTSAAAGVALTTGFLSFIAFLAVYDIVRRTTCSGDFLGLGGPGFTSPITPTMSIITPPKCHSVSNPRPIRRHRDPVVLRVKG